MLETLSIDDCHVLTLSKVSVTNSVSLFLPTGMKYFPNHHKSYVYIVKIENIIVMSQPNHWRQGQWSTLY